MIIVKDSIQPKYSQADIDALATVEHQKKRLDMCRRAMSVLTRTYPGYIWGARAEGMCTISITEAKLLEWGGDIQCMHIHDPDWTCLQEFDALVAKLGGELLERASQSREMGNQYGVDKLPDGFNERFVKNRKVSKMKMVGPNGESIEEMVNRSKNRHIIEGFEKDQQKNKSPIIVV